LRALSIALDQCRASEIASNKIMGRFSELQLTSTAPPEVHSDTVRGRAAMVGKLGLTTVPAAWPTGVSPLAQAVDACQRRDTREVDWLARASNSIVLLSAFSPKGRAFAR
jgi:hypothetical protein